MTNDARTRLSNLRDALEAVANGVAARGIVDQPAGTPWADGYEAAMRDIVHGINIGLLSDPTTDEEVTT